MDIEIRFLYTELNLSKEFKKIEGEFLQHQLTESNIAELYYAYEDLFKKYDVDIKFKLEINTYFNNVMFIPIREIDKLAIKAILQ